MAKRRKTVDPETRAEVWEKTNGRCWYCGVALSLEPWHHDALTVDHVVPVSLGGSDHIGNLVPSCRVCNSAKTNGHDLEALRRFLKTAHNQGREIDGSGVSRFVFWHEASENERRLYGGHGSVGDGHTMPRWRSKQERVACWADRVWGKGWESVVTQKEARQRFEAWLERQK